MTEIKSVMEDVKKIGEMVDEYLVEHLKGKIKMLWDAANHYIIAGGKRLRPFLVVKAYSMLKSDLKTIIPAASATEILHTFTLIHDDIMDKDEMRRGVSSVHTKWDEPLAILAGDLLFSMVFVLVDNLSIDSALKSKITYELGQVSALLCEGQAMDISFETRNDVKIDEYLEMIRLKTGVLFGTSATIGAIASNATEQQIASLQEYGEKIGISFQIVDDILGLIAEQDKLGKPVGSDIRKNKKTYLLLYALGHLSVSDKNELMSILNKKTKTQNDVEYAIRLIKKSGALDQAKNLALGLINDAKNALNLYPDSPAKISLLNLADLVIDRKF